MCPAGRLTQISTLCPAKRWPQTLLTVAVSRVYVWPLATKTLGLVLTATLRVGLELEINVKFARGVMLLAIVRPQGRPGIESVEHDGGVVESFT